MERTIRFFIVVKKWFDKVNGNTYHSVKATDTQTGKVYIKGITYGYGSHYEHTAINLLVDNGLIDSKYKGYEYSKYQRENNYPIEWEVIEDCKKRDLDKE